jgi:hypothetical protein
MSVRFSKLIIWVVRPEVLSLFLGNCSWCTAIFLNLQCYHARTHATVDDHEAPWKHFILDFVTEIQEPKGCTKPDSWNLAVMLLKFRWMASVQMCSSFQCFSAISIGNPICALVRATRMQHLHFGDFCPFAEISSWWIFRGSTRGYYGSQRICIFTQKLNFIFLEFLSVHILYL